MSPPLASDSPSRWSSNLLFLIIAIGTEAGIANVWEGVRPHGPGQVLEGRVRVDPGKVRRHLVRVTIPAGAFRVATDQPLGDLAIVLLDTESPDSFFQWRFMLSVFTDAAYSEPYVLEPLAERMLQVSPVLHHAFETQLASDPAFAGSAERRRAWLLQLTPYADADHRVYPILREY